MPLSQLFFWTVPIVALASYCLLMLFFSISKKDKHILMFMLVLASSILWTGSSLLMKTQLYPGVLFWNRVMVTGMSIYPFLLYCFVSAFTNTFSFFQIIVWGIATLVAIIANLSGLIVTEASVITTTMVKNGKQFTLVEFSYSLGKIAALLYVFMLIFIIAILVKTRRSVCSGAAYGRVSLVTAGIFVMFAGQLFNIVPAIGKYPIDILACFINAILIMIAIYKYRLLELRFMITRGLVLTLFGILITVFYIYLVFFIEKRVNYLSWKITPYFTTLSALLVALIFQPLYGFMRSLVDKMFYKAEYSRRQALRNFSINIANNLDLNDIARELIGSVQLAIHAKQVFVLIKNEEEQHYYVFACSSQLYKPELQISFDNPLINWLFNNNSALSREKLYSIPLFKSMWEKEKKIFYDLDLEVVVPIKSRNDLTGMLILTRKDNNTAYTLDDLDLLTYLGASTAVAFDNARLYTLAQSEALTDSLTKLYNHRCFCRILPEQIGKIGSAELSLLMIDLDLFRLFNDLYGHFEGDRALETVAAIMTGIVGQKGIVCRYGGEEFAILLPYHDSKKAFELAEKIRLEIQKTFFNLTDVTQRFLTASIGICTYPHAAPNAVELLKRADLAMYTAKNKGKNKTEIYTPNHFAPPGMSEQEPNRRTIQSSSAATIYALTAAIDAKDHYTFGHSQRVAQYATILASSLGLDQTHLELVREAALLHDIGKIGIPENILTKTGSLTDEEFEIVKRHVEMSITMIKYLPSLNHIIPAVIGHHERWDGKGYPRGVRGENIPLSARCLAITDSFDAMTSDRPYRASLGVEAALQEIEKNIGTQFDPQIAVLFIKLVQTRVIKVEQTMDTNEVS